MARSKDIEVLRPEITLVKDRPMTVRLLAEAHRSGRSLPTLILAILEERDAWLQGERPRPLWLPADPSPANLRVERELAELLALIRRGELVVNGSSPTPAPALLDEAPVVSESAAAAGSVWGKRRKKTEAGA